MLLTRPYLFGRRQICSSPRLGGGLNRAWQQKRNSLGHATRSVAAVIVFLVGCATTGSTPKSVLAYQTADGQWHDEVSRVVAPVISKRVDPVWPPALRDTSNQGTVVMRLLVSREGAVQDVVVTESVNEAMDRQAALAAHQWGYMPATLDGQPVAVWLRVTVTWRLG